ncbi:MAG: tRNA (adenosine(37)-N6)-threonylcarbamoyltransferase complex transferase subunit TsaD [Candidatus Saccharibacteria bacterium]|nr:tRNA (adenosine(37)-N6)-threonylcarbamoyltransferase complex transferase subunit TsaD [Candidatus Saccharibacteria bacterium]
MRILGIESSCDETAAAVVENGRRLLSNVVNSQIDIHAEYGGVIPEIAARSHLEVINPVVNKALSDAGCTWDDIDAIAVTYAPGLIGSLLVGSLAARTLAVIHDKPLFKIHHVEAHVYANFVVEQADGGAGGLGVAEEAVTGASSPVSRTPRAGEATRKEYSEAAPKSPAPLTLPARQPTFPLLSLIVSGGHSQLVLFRSHGDYELIGQTQDDAVGEAFDKVAKILGLPYPGGPAISKAATSGDPHTFQLPTARLQGKYDFSFSGLKTAVLRAVQREVGKDFTFPSHQLPSLVDDELRHNMAASFQYTAIKTLVNKTRQAFDDFQPASVVIAGGVAANQELRRQLREALPIDIDYAPIQLCTDNAAMIATLGYYRAQIDAPSDPYDFEVQPSLAMTAT